jgi:SET domain-containing protein
MVKIHGSLFIDGSKSTCLAKNANHSCQPNSVLQKVSRDVYGADISPYGNKDWDTELWIKAIVDIPKNEEITYNYGNQFTFNLGECLCGKCKNI